MHTLFVDIAICIAICYNNVIKQRNGVTIMIKITNDIYYIGVNDHNIDLFEGQYVVPNGMAYNSYIILDEKIAVFDTVDGNFGDEWLGKISEVLGDRSPDYLIVQHMEPDHSANIEKFEKIS